MSPIVRFYNGSRVQDIQSWSDDRLESVHDFIQWLLPLPEPSGVNPGAPVLDAETIASFQSSPELKEKLTASFVRMLQFYGLTYQGGEVRRDEHFSSRASNWLTPGNHNHLRITRMLRSMKLLGLEAESRAFFAALTSIYTDYPELITKRTFRFWSES